MNVESYRKLIRGILVAWFVGVVSASALGVFRNDSARLGLAVAVAAAAPVVAYFVWYAASAGFRQFAFSLSPRVLTLAQVWRVNAFVFLALYSIGLLPGIFAIPAGWGDIAAGATAIYAARSLASSLRRNGFILWHVLGLADLVMAVTLGTTAGLLRPGDTPMTVMSILPMSVVPTFLVPLLTILHIICITQARRWRKQETSAGAGEIVARAA